MNLTFINNSTGDGKSYILNRFISYLNSRGRGYFVFDYFSDYSYKSFNKEINYKNISSLEDFDKDDLFNYLIELGEQKKMNLFNTSGSLNESHLLLILLSKFLIVPVIYTDYYRDNYFRLIIFVKKVYADYYEKNCNITLTLKKLPRIIIIPVLNELSDDFIDTIISFDYEDLIILENKVTWNGDDRNVMNELLDNLLF